MKFSWQVKNGIFKTEKINMAKTFKEEFSVHGEQLLKKVKDLIAEGNIRKITIKDKNGKELVTFPLTIGVVGAVFAPVLAAIGAAAASRAACAARWNII